MIYITGDTHGEISRFREPQFFGKAELGKEDYVIVCGDFGFLFYPESYSEYPTQQAELAELAKKPYNILFVDGNHENFPMIYSYPVEQWNGGKVHRIAGNILHLMRGQVYCIEGKNFFTMGGAYSIDKYIRREGLSWWREELPTNDEYREATQNLLEVGNTVDVILTHTAPREIIRKMGKYPDVHDAELTGFFDWILHEVQFRQWFFGHWHTDLQVDEKFRALWFDTVKLEEKNT